MFKNLPRLNTENDSIYQLDQIVNNLFGEADKKTKTIFSMTLVVLIKRDNSTAIKGGAIRTSTVAIEERIEKKSSS